MGRKQDREQIIAATTPSLGSGEHIRSCSAVWAAECGGRVPLIFRARSRHFVALTDQRLILFRAPRRRRPLTTDEMLIAKRHSSFTLEKASRFSPLLQVRHPGYRRSARSRSSSAPVTARSDASS